MPIAKTCETRADSCQELSVNIEDDDGALVQLKGRGDVHGIARVAVAAIDDLKKLNKLSGIERSPEKSNPYHGNILFPKMGKTDTRVVASYILIHAVAV